MNQISNMRLCLGTVQFGLHYGINNKNGRVSSSKIPEILNHAYSNGITMLDTASAYGISETVLGKAIADTKKDFKIITKYPSNTGDRPLKWINNSLNCLKKEKIYAYLFHSFSSFQNSPDYIEDFVILKESGKCDKIGFSLYYPSEAEFILENNIPCDIVQIPYNIYDKRFAYLFKNFKSRGIDVYVRSVFLQGLFFISPDKLDIHFNSIKDLQNKIYAIADNYSLDISALCLYFVYTNMDISNIVIGVDSLDNLKDNLHNYYLLKNLNIPNHIFDEFTVTDENIILPFNWNK